MRGGRNDTYRARHSTSPLRRSLAALSGPASSPEPLGNGTSPWSMSRRDRRGSSSTWTPPDTTDPVDAPPAPGTPTRVTDDTGGAWHVRHVTRVDERIVATKPDERVRQRIAAPRSSPTDQQPDGDTPCLHHPLTPHPPSPPRPLRALVRHVRGMSMRGFARFAGPSTNTTVVSCDGLRDGRRWRRLAGC
jgi:hypothetical protein